MGGLCGVSQKQADAEVQHRTRPRPHNTTSAGTQAINPTPEVRKPEEKKGEKFIDMEEYKGKI